MQFVIEEDGGSKKIVYCIADIERFDFYSYEMLCENEIEGVIGLQYTERNGLDAVLYDVTKYDTLRNHLSFSITMNNLLSIFTQIISIVEEIEEYLLDNSLLITDIGQIFYDRSSNEVKMIYFPVAKAGDFRTCEEKMFILFREIIFSAKFVVGNDDRYITELLNGISDINDYSLTDFKAVVNNLTEKIGGDRLFNEPEENRRLHDECSEISADTTDTIKDETEEFVADERKAGIRSLIKRLFFKEDGEKEQVLTDYQLDFSDETIEEPEEDEETIVIAEKEDDETVVLVRGETGIYTPYLIRVSNNQRIDILKRVFKVGKDKRYADYIIDDNAAISRAHAEFMIKDGKIYLTDEDSLNGTYVNGEKLISQQEKELKNEDVILFADEEYMLYC